MTVTVEQFNQSPLGLMCQGLLAWMKQDYDPLVLATTQLLLLVLEEKPESLPERLLRQKETLLEMVLQMEEMEPEQALDRMFPHQEISVLEAANRLAMRLTMRPQDLPRDLLEMMLIRDAP